jgi:predicted exporter
MRQAAKDTSEGIASVSDQLPANSPLRRIGKALAALSHGTDQQMATANQALTQFLPYTLHQLADSLSAEPITMQSLPEDLKRDWFAPDRRVRVQVTPTTKAQSTAGLRDFVKAVQQVAPDAAGSAVDTIRAADTILIAFREAAVYATAAIAIVLMLVLRRARDAGLVLATLLMSALLTALLARMLGISINFANIIALPLLLGVGVSFNVYFVMNWRHGMHLFLGSPTARAILFSALTTGTAFGSLAIARHPGTASMGTVLLLSLLAVLLSTFAFLPAMLYSIGHCKQPISHT